MSARFARASVPLFALVLACAGCGADRSRDSLGIDSARIEEHMRVLAADDMEGRATGTTGYRRAAEYVAGKFAEIGLEPAAGDGSFFQSVPLIAAHLMREDSALNLVRGDATSKLELGTDFVLQPDFLRESAELTAPLAYVGFGVRAPAFGHDDYAGVDVRGKIALMFAGAPAHFPHSERAYYAKTTNKLETAAGLGAVGVVFMMLPQERLNYPWDAVVADSEMPAMLWLEPDGTPHGAYGELFVIATLSPDGEARLFDGEEQAREDVFAAAEAGEPVGFDMAAQLNAFVVSHHQRLKSPNVVARLAGSDDEAAAEHVVLTAHLDHVGAVPVEAGKDGIHNGAYDNASGVAMLLEVAAALAAGEPPRRSVLFLAPTGEERGLLGSGYFAEHPSVEIDALVANVNLDMVMMLHPLKDVVAFGAEHSTLQQAVERSAGELGIRVAPDPIPELVFFVRSDQYSFVAKGIPAIFLVSGFDAGPDDGLERFHEWMRTVYHSPADDMGQTFDFEAGADFARLNLMIATDVANADEPPRWNAGDFFGELFGN